MQRVWLLLANKRPMEEPGRRGGSRRGAAGAREAVHQSGGARGGLPTDNLSKEIGIRSGRSRDGGLEDLLSTIGLRLRPHLDAEEDGEGQEEYEDEEVHS